MNKTGKTPEPVKVRYSIARRLNAQLFFRLLGIYLSVDILLCVIVSASLFIYSERAAASAAQVVTDTPVWGIPAPALSETSGVTAEKIAFEADGFRIMKPFRYLLPHITADSRRTITYEDTSVGFKLRRFDKLSYNVYFQTPSAIFRISVRLGAFLHFARYVVVIVLICELVGLLSRFAKDRRIVAAALNPISELAEAAKSINQESPFDPAKMAALASKLEGINASKLDTRIQVDETQAELKNIAMAINGMLDRINEAYRAQVRFVSDASHELRTPISVIQGYANLLDRWGKNDEKTLQESITAIKDEAANMKELVEHLLFLARGDNNTIQLQLEEVPLAKLAEEVVFEAQLIDTAHHFDLRTAEVAVIADRSLIKQALRILIDNAIKYTDSGGNITAAVDREGDTAKLSVTDDGIGIRSDVVPYIFDRFYRADESRAKATGGAGLGLSIAKWIVSRHGGHMEVLSRLGIGTRIVIALPAAGQGIAQAPPAE